MPDMKVLLELIAKSEKFQQGFQQGERALGSFRTHVSNTMQKVQQLTANVGVLGQAATALSTGLVLKKLFSVADYMPIDDALLRMRVNLKASGAEMDAFKKKVASLSGEIGENTGDTFQGAYKLSFMYKPDDIMQIMRVTDKTADAMKAPFDVVQDRIVQIMKLYRLTAKEAASVGEALVASRVDVESLDTVMQRLVLRGGSKKEYTQTLGMLRGLGMAGMSNPRVIMQLNETLGAIQDKADILEASGIKVRKINADGTTEWRDQLEVLKDLESYLAKWRKQVPIKVFDEKLDQVFGPNSRMRLDFIFSQKENFKKGMEEMGNAAQIAAERSAAAEATWEKQLNKIKGHLGSIKTDFSFIYDLAKKPVKFMADSPNATKAAGYAAAGASAAVLGYLAYTKGRDIFTGAGKIKDVLTSGPFGKMTGPIPVYVVNKRMSLIDMPGGVKDPNTGVPVPGGSKMGKFARGLGNVFAVTGAGFAGYEVGGLLNEGMGWASGKLTGGKHKGEGWLGDMLYDFLHKAERPQVKNDIKLNISIDKDGRIIADSGNHGTDISVALNRGAFFAL
jgi:hypothetical protein